MAGAAEKRARAERKNRVTDLALRAYGAFAARMRDSAFARTGLLSVAFIGMGAGWGCLGAGFHALGTVLIAVASLLGWLAAESMPNS